MNQNAIYFNGIHTFLHQKHDDLSINCRYENIFVAYNATLSKIYIKNYLNYVFL